MYGGWINVIWLFCNEGDMRYVDVCFFYFYVFKYKFFFIIDVNILILNVFWLEFGWLVNFRKFWNVDIKLSVFMKCGIFFRVVVNYFVVILIFFWKLSKRFWDIFLIVRLRNNKGFIWMIFLDEKNWYWIF